MGDCTVSGNCSMRTEASAFFANLYREEEKTRPHIDNLLFKELGEWDLS